MSPLAFSQNSKIPEVLLENESEKSSNYKAILKIKDNDALFFKLTYKIFGSNARMKSYYIVYMNNGKVEKYILTYTYKNKDLKIEKVKLRRKDYKTYWSFLNDGVNENRFKFDLEKLTSTSIPSDDSGNSKKISVSDGGGLVFEIAHKNRYSLYYSDNAETYIKYKSYGYMEKQRFLDLIGNIQILFDTNSYSR